MILYIPFVLIITFIGLGGCHTYTITKHDVEIIALLTCYDVSKKLAKEPNDFSYIYTACEQKSKQFSEIYEN